MIREIILSYAKKPSSLLLAIIPANIDIVNSEALKFVSEIDPAGQRTLGVLSKIDLMDQGTNALDILLNRGPVRLALGFVGVVCRSQKAINEGTSIQQSLENEEKFFSMHPIYRCPFDVVLLLDQIPTLDAEQNRFRVSFRAYC